MKKGKVFTKNQAVLALMVLCLGAAVWLNMKFSSTEKYLGEATYVSSSSKESGTVATSAGTKEKDTDYFKTAKTEREQALKEAQELVEETLKSADVTDEEKKDALSVTKNLALRIEREDNIENLLIAKGFKSAVAVIGDKDINVVVKADGLTTAQTLQIQDIVTSQTEIPLSNIKIVTVK